MDWKLALATFGVIFLAELGDKTQLAALALAGRSGKPLSVFAGASAALVLVTLVGILAGAFLRKVVPERAAEIGSGALFIVVGAILLIRALTARAG